MTRAHEKITATRCAEYLREIGVGLDESDVQSWIDAEKAEAMVARMKRTVATRMMHYCECGETRVIVRGGVVAYEKLRAKAIRCSTCEGPLCYGRLVWEKLADGTVIDHRPQDERWMSVEVSP